MGESQSTPGRPIELRDPSVSRGPGVLFSFEGRPIEAFAGESVAAALMSSGIRMLRASPRAGEGRGAFCWMGLCQECTVRVEGVRRPACRTPVRDGLVVLSGTIA